MNLLADGGFAGTQLNVLLDQCAMVGEARTGAKRFWTTREIAILRETYPTGGLAACLPLLPGRASTAIYQKAFEVGARRPAPSGKPRATRQVYTPTPALDAAIVDAYRSDNPLRGLKNLSRVTGRPRAWLTNRAAVLGLSRPKFKEAQWCAAEFEILTERMHQAPGTIRQALREAGYPRTINAIVLQLRRRKGWARGKVDGQYTKLMLQECFGVSGETLSRWARIGLRVIREPAIATGKAHDAAEWSVRELHLRRFVMENVAIIDFRKVDKFWLVDLLTSRRPDKGAEE